MLIIVGGSNIEYTKGDTFSMDITSLDGFEEGTQLDFVITDNENNSPLINNTYSLNSNGSFTVTLTTTETSKLSYRDYLYKLTLHMSDGTIITQKSGNFKVKWGA